MVRVLFTSALATAAALLSATQVAASTTTAGLKLYGVNYNIRAGPDWAPDATKCKSADVIDEELAKLKTITDTIRLYSLSDCDQAAKVIPAAAKAGLNVTLGLWVGPDPATFATEKAKLEELLSQDGLVTAQNTPAIYVGSEAILRKEVNATTAIANIKEVRTLCAAKKLSVPITLADTADVILKNPKLIDAVDFVSPNIFPFWSNVAAAKGPAQLYSKIEQLVKIAKGKDIVIGETGFPSNGTIKGYPDGSMASATTYFQGFWDLAQKHNLKYYYFAGFDESWKLTSSSANSDVEAYFGIFDKDGEIKDAYKALKPAAAAATTTAPVASSSSADSDVEVGSGSSAASSSVDVGMVTTSTTAPASKSPSATPAPVASSSSSPSVTPVATAAPSSDDDEYVPGAVSGAGKDSDTDSKASSPVETSFVVVPDSKSSSVDKAATLTAGKAATVTAGKAATAAPATVASAAPATAASAAKGSSEGPAASGKKKRKDCDA